MTTDTLGGVFSYATSLVSWLSSRGVRVTLASMGSAITDEQRAAVARAGAALRESTYRLEWMEDPWADVRRAGEWLLALERELRPDVVHLNGYAHAALPWRAPTCVIAHSCVCSWYRAVRGHAAPESWAQYRAAVWAGLAAATRLIAPTRAMLEALRREYALPLHADVIANGVTLPRDGAWEPREEFVLSAGRLWDEAKNMAALQAVARSLAWPIRVAGAATEPGRRESIHLPDLELLGALSREELGGWMKRAAIFASPALYEPFGLAILEAASSGCALVLGDIPSLRELWSDCAVFVDPRAPSALAAALDGLMRDHSLRRALARRARQRAHGYALERMGKAYLRCYESLNASPVAEHPLELSP
jgi:glycogen(starch) synthase